MKLVMRYFVFFVSVLFLVPLEAWADIEFRHAWSRATAPGMPMGAVYGHIENKGDEDVTLISIEVDSARMAEVHESIEIDGMMRMREIVPFTIPAGEIVILKPAGRHIMLMGLSRALVQGQSIELSVTFSNGEKVQTSAVIGGFGQMSLPN